MDDVSTVMTLLAVLLTIAYVLGKILARFNIAPLVGHIFVGIIFVSLVITFPNWCLNNLGFNIDTMYDSFSYNFFNIMGEFGIVFLMFTVGLETKISDLVKTPKVSYYIAIIGILIPFACGMVYGVLMNYSTEASLLISTALFAMSTAITVNVLQDLDAMKTYEAKIIISASVIDDILCLTLLAMVSGFVRPDVSNDTLIANLVIIIAFIIIAFLVTWKIKPITKIVIGILSMPLKAMNVAAGGKSEILKIDEIKKENAHNATVIAIVVCMILALVSTRVGLASVIGAFIAGMVFAEFKEELPCEDNFKLIADITLPFFFIFVGMNIRYDQLSTGIIMPCIILCIIAVASKFIGGYLGARAGKMDKDSSILIGCSMIPRGEVGVLVAGMGLGYMAFPHDVYTELIIMTIVTSILSPLLVRWAYNRMHKNDDQQNQGKIADVTDSGA